MTLKLANDIFQHSLLIEEIYVTMKESHVLKIHRMCNVMDSTGVFWVLMASLSIMT